MPREILFNLLDEIQTEKKDENTTIGKKEIRKKSKTNKVSVLIFT